MLDIFANPETHIPRKAKQHVPPTFLGPQPVWQRQNKEEQSAKFNHLILATTMASLISLLFVINLSSLYTGGKIQPLELKRTKDGKLKAVGDVEKGKAYVLTADGDAADETLCDVHLSAAQSRDTVRVAQKALRRYSGFTCYAALAPHRASNIEDVSYQILLGEKKYFVSTDGGGEQMFARLCDLSRSAAAVEAACGRAPVQGVVVMPCPQPAEAATVPVPQQAAEAHALVARQKDHSCGMFGE